MCNAWISKRSCFVVADISKNRAAMNRVITTVVSLLLVALSSVECEMCGESNEVFFSVNIVDCLDAFQESDARLYSNITACFFFGTMNFTTISVESWSESFKECTDDTSSPINFVNVGSFDGVKNLERTVCLKYDMTLDGSCSCRMNCLLEFSSDNYIFLIAVGCNETQFNNSLLVYQKHENASMTRMGYFICPTSSVSSSIMSSSLSSSSLSSSSAVPIIMSTSSSIPGITNTIFEPTPTMSVPSTCEEYDIKAVSKNDAYCSAICTSDVDLNPLKSSLKTACNSIGTNNYYLIMISESESTDKPNFNECLQESSDPIISELFNSTEHCNTDNSWKLRNISCECIQSNDNSCSVLSSSTPCLSNCFFWFSRESEQQTHSFVFISGLTDSNKQSLLSNIVPSLCGVKTSFGDQESCCLTSSSSGTPSGSVSPTITMGVTDDGISFNMFYIQLGVGIIGGTTVLLLLSIILLCVVVLVKRRRRSKNFRPDLSAVNGTCGPSSPTSTVNLSISPLVTTMFSQSEGSCLSPTDYSKWRRIFSRYIVDHGQIDVMETIGEGAFGLVQRGEFQNENGQRVQVAIKGMKDASTPDQVEEFISESAIMLDFDHPNVLKLLGVCFDTEHQLPLIILPYMANGDLKTFLQTKRRKTTRGNIPEGLSVALLINLCLDVAKGMAYLAKRKFVHRDLAGRNCMVDENMLVKVADFGLSRDVYSKDYYRLERRVKLPVKWLPPESLHDNIFTEKTDVWSFGVTCWEVFSLGRTPYPSIDNADILDYIEQGLRLKKPPLCPKEIYLLLSRCWDDNPEVRPSFITLVDSMKTILSNWEGHDNSLQRQMESEIRWSLEQDGYESDSLELDQSGSMAVRVGSLSSTRVNRYRKKSGEKKTSMSSSSSVLATTNSTSALVSSSTVVEDLGRPNEDFTTDHSVHNGIHRSQSLDDDNNNNHLNPTDHSSGKDHHYYNFAPSHDCTGECNCHCSGGSQEGETHEHEYKFQSSPENSGKPTEGSNQATTPVPMFEMLYDSTPKSLSMSQKSCDLSGRSLERSFEISQSSFTTQESTVPNTPLETQTSKLPHNYTLPVKSKSPKVRKYSSGSRIIQNGLPRHGGQSRTRSDGSKSTRSPSTSSSRMTSSPHLDSPTNHFYFTLDPVASTNDNDTTLPVFEGETDSSQNSSNPNDIPRSAHVYSSRQTSDSSSPMLAYIRDVDSPPSHRMVNGHDRHGGDNSHLQPQPNEETVLDENEVVTKHFPPHRHLLLDHGVQAQKFE